MLRVAELDAIDGTPVLDIKPVMREFLPRTAVRQPAWVARADARLLERARMTGFAWIIFVVAATLEVGGDAVIRRGLRGRNALIVVGGMLTVAAYGLVVNVVRWDFSRLLGVYVAFFALVSVLCGRVIFGERVLPATWVGLAFIVTGGLIIQFGGGR